MDFLMQNILVLVCFFPLMGIPIILLIPKGNRSDSRVKWTANIVAFCGFIISLPLIIYFNRTDFIDATTGMRFLVRKSSLVGWQTAPAAPPPGRSKTFSRQTFAGPTQILIDTDQSWRNVGPRTRTNFCGTNGAPPFSPPSDSL